MKPSNNIQWFVWLEANTSLMKSSSSSSSSTTTTTFSWSAVEFLFLLLSLFSFILVSSSNHVNINNTTIFNVTQKSLRELLFECRDFDPKTSENDCGHSIPALNGQWTIQKTYDLIDVMSVDTDNLIGYVLLMNGSDQEPVIHGGYMLNGPNLGRESVVCIQYELVHSSPCQKENIECLTNITLRHNQFNDTLLFPPDAVLHYKDSGWTVMMAQFNMNKVLHYKQNWRFTINGYILQSKQEDYGDHPQKKFPDINNKPYIAISLIRVTQGECPRRIGPRKTFWIAIIIVFSLLTMFVFVHLAIRMAVKQYRMRLWIQRTNSTDVRFQSATINDTTAPSFTL